MTLAELTKLTEERRKAIADARAVVEGAEKENRDLSTEEQTSYKSYMDDAETKQERIKRLKEIHEADQEDAENRRLIERAGESAGLLAGDGDTDPVGDATRDALEGGLGNEVRSVMAGIVVPDRLTVGKRTYRKPADLWDENTQRRRAIRMLAYRAALLDSVSPDPYTRANLNQFRSRLTDAEERALQADVDTAGGYLVAPMELASTLIKAVDDAVYIRQWATVETVDSAESLGIPSLDADPADSDWTAEIATGSEDSAMKFGRRELHPHPLAKRLKVSRKLLRLTSNGAETVVRDRLGYKFGVTWEKAGLVGHGNNQPLGVFVASNDGIPTSRDESTGNTTTAIVADNLVRTKYSLKGGYLANARWMAHRDFWLQVALLKDSNGQYIWRESVRVGEPDRLLGVPAFSSEYAPNTFAASQYVAIIGDFSKYMIADALTLDIQKLEELYAETNQVGFIGRLESDGMPVLGEAFARVQLAAS